MNSDIPKVLYPVAGKAMISHVLTALETAGVNRRVVVVAPDQDSVVKTVAPAQTAVQTQPLGTGDAVRAALGAIEDFTGTVLVVFGDTPLITAATLRRMVEAMQAPSAPAGVVLGFPSDDPGRYGRLVEDDAGRLERIVEYAEMSGLTRTVRLCNGGAMALDGIHLEGLLAGLANNNAKGEFYLTDLVALARDRGLCFSVVETVESETMGVDSRAALARAEGVMQQRLRAAAMTDGATLIAPETVFLSHDTILGRDTVVQPHVVIGPGVRVGERVEIRSFSHLEQARVADDAVIGPYARLRPGAEVGAEARIGNFVEVKAATIDWGAKVNHLAYIGDAHVGAETNIGAGTITCNFDGFAKHRSEIGDRVFIGSNTALVAPVSVGDGAIVGAGSTVTESIDADALFVMRGKANLARDGAKRFRARRRRRNDVD